MASRLSQYSQQAQDGYGYEELKPIPKGTELPCFVEECKWEEYNGQKGKDEFIKLRLRSLPNTEYPNRVLFQKLYILGKVDQDAEKNETTVDNAYLFLAALDNICLGGALARLPNDPEDEDLAKLQNKQILVMVGVNSYNNQYNERVTVNNVRQLLPMPSRGGTQTARSDAADGGESQPRQRRARR